MPAKPVFNLMLLEAQGRAQEDLRRGEVLAVQVKRVGLLPVHDHQHGRLAAERPDKLEPVFGILPGVVVALAATLYLAFNGRPRDIAAPEVATAPPAAPAKRHARAWQNC